jgi:hypothetical protein
MHGHLNVISDFIYVILDLVQNFVDNFIDFRV